MSTLAHNHCQEYSFMIIHTRNSYFSTYYEGIPSYYLDNHKPVPNKLLESYWFGSGENSPAIVEYLLKAYPAEIEVRPDMLRLREIEELKMPCYKREHFFSGHSREFPGSSPRARAHAFQSTK